MYTLTAAKIHTRHFFPPTEQPSPHYQDGHAGKTAAAQNFRDLPERTNVSYRVGWVTPFLNELSDSQL